MKFDYRTLSWTVGGYLLFTILFAQYLERIFNDWRYGIPIIFLGALIGFILDQYYKKKEFAVHAVSETEGKK